MAHLRAGLNVDITVPPEITVSCRAVDLDSLNPDPDTDSAFHVSPDRIQGFDDQKLKKKIPRNFFFISLFDQNCNLLLSKLQGAFSPQRLALLNPGSGSTALAKLLRNTDLC